MLISPKNILNVLVANNFCHAMCRWMATKGNVRVRFGPSPTGYLHLGGLRTALYNQLFSRSHNGVFILRIEDTDQARIVPGALQRLEDDLTWAGIVADEGPSTGGEYGPYIQSQRLDLYRQEVACLVETGSAYHCFCTTVRLDLLKREAVRLGQVPRYDNRCRQLTQQQVSEKLAAGVSSCVRFKLGPVEPFTDLVYGESQHDVSALEGDPIILKTDGYPTYHLANVVDDHHMAITHVLRGVEWHASTSKHLLLYRAFGWEPPQFAHLPLLKNADGTKLSKRQDDMAVDHYRSDGIFPLALVNFVTNAGGGFKRPRLATDTASTETVISNMEQLADRFDLKLVNTNSGRLPMHRLLEFNRAELDRQIGNAAEMAALVADLKCILHETLNEKIKRGDVELDSDYIHSSLIWSHGRVTRLRDLAGPEMMFLWLRPLAIDLSQQDCGTLARLLPELSSLADFKRNTLSPFLRDFAQQQQVPFNEMMKLLRVTLSGLTQGPSVVEMIEILGRERTLSRIERAILVRKDKVQNEPVVSCQKES